MSGSDAAGGLQVAVDALSFFLGGLAAAFAGVAAGDELNTVIDAGGWGIDADSAARDALEAFTKALEELEKRGYP